MALHPEVQPILSMLEEMGMPPLDSTTPEQLREMMAMPPPENPVAVAKVEERELPGGGGPINARLYWPEGDGPFPLTVFFHGGGFVMANLDTHDDLCRRLCGELGSVVVSVDYRLAPEAKFPAAPEDCYAATRWCAEHAKSLKADPDRLIVAGDSAGGCLAAAVCLMALDRGGPPIHHQLLIYPVTDRNFERESYLSFSEGYFLTREMMQWFWDHYLEQADDAHHPYASPLQAKSLKGVPAATVITAGYDPLRDEGKAYADRLKTDGIPVEYRCYEDQIHGFLGLLPVTNDHDYVAELAECVRKAL